MLPPFERNYKAVKIIDDLGGGWGSPEVDAKDFGVLSRGKSRAPDHPSAATQPDHYSEV
jgi:hypothetical protein